MDLCLIAKTLNKVRHNIRWVAFTIAVFAVAAPTWAQENEDDTGDMVTTLYAYQVHLGILAGESQDPTKTETEIELNAGMITSALQGPPIRRLNTYAYGYTMARLELGTGFGIQGHHAGFGGLHYALTSPMQGNGTGFHFGIEPLAISYSANTNDVREDYFAWEPMLSAGLRWFTGKTAWMIYPKFGGAISTFDPASSTGLAWGVVSMFTFERFRFNVELLRVNTTNSAVDRIYADMTILQQKKFSIALTLDTLFPRADSGDFPLAWGESNTNSEYRVSLLMRFRPPKVISGANSPVI